MNIYLRKVLLIAITCWIVPIDNSYAQCAGDFSGNLITNGNFESGTTAIESDYGYVANAASMGKTKWTVTTPCCASGAYRPATVSGQPGDHTLGTTTGSYMLIDADNQANFDAWRTTVSVLPSTTYYFSAWIANVNWMNDNPSQLRFSVGGTQIGPIITSTAPSGGTEASQDHSWVQFFTTWNSGATSGPVTIRMENINTNGEGNDLALDDIVFSSSCKFVDYPVTSQLPDTLSLCNGGGSVLLDSKIPSAGNSFTWRLNGATVGGSTPSYTATAAGKYYLCYDLFGRNCPKTDSVVVLGNKFFIDLGPNVTLCSPPNVTLDAGVVSPPVIVRWYKNNVRVPDDSNSTLVVNSPGTYRADAFIPGNPACGTGTDNITISTSTTANPSDVFFCGNTPTNVNLAVTGSGTYEWYANPTGSTLAAGTKSGANGENFTTAPITTDMTYYVEDKTVFLTGGFTPEIPFGAYSGTSSGNTNQGTGFTAYAPFRLDSVTVFATTYGIPPAGSPKTVGVTLYSGNPPTLTVVASKLCTLSVTDPTSGVRHPYQLDLGFQVPAAGNYYLEYTSGTAEINGVDKDVATTANYSAYKIPGLIQLTGILQKNGTVNSYFNDKYLYFYDWIIGAGTLCGRVPVYAKANCALPVSFMDFQVYKNGKAASLVWITANETNNSFFAIEKSTDGINFNPIGNVLGAGTTESIHQYTFLDASPASGITYYRIKQVDFNGEYSYSKIGSIHFEALSEQVTIYSSEVGIHVTFFLSTEEEVITRIIDVLGREIYSHSGNYKAGRYEIAHSLKSSPGIYFVTIVSKNLGNESKKIVK